MPSDSVREQLAQEIETRLNKIQGGTDYNFTLAVPVQRYKHVWNRETHEVAQLAETPGIVFRPALGTIEPSDDSRHQEQVTFEIEFLFAGDDASDAELNKAIHDVQRALFTDASGDPDEWFAINALGVSLEVALFDPETGMPFDGLRFSLTVTYRSVVGNPASTG